MPTAILALAGPGGGSEPRLVTLYVAGATGQHGLEPGDGLGLGEKPGPAETGLGVGVGVGFSLGGGEMPG